MNTYHQDRALTSKEIRTSEEIGLLTDEELDGIAGGATAGQNDPAQMFEQILKQLTKDQY
ncbi:hypothetical protein QA634_16910 [Methylobacterium sp. CB376]|uniref:hypothetical protein n=1 Tax=unclassified Methylobacterium TaxID=2615210 RepID=UPI0012378295|nr:MULTISPECIES: hypothetical protein [Methylobacterium]WFT83406.1 hypothetical protein QA634_16910 [Methylobacterium nodulans]